MHGDVIDLRTTYPLPMMVWVSVEVRVVASARIPVEELAQLVPVPAAVRELRRRVRDATLMSDASPTLSHVFALSEKIELNMVEERVMTSSFARNTTTTLRIPHSTAQCRPIGGGSGSREVQTQHPSGLRVPSARPPLPSFSGQPHGPSCRTCGGGHMRKDCPHEKGRQTLQARPQPAQVVGIVAVMLHEAKVVEVAKAVGVVEVPVPLSVP
ncbi:hypothetical protein AXG93_2710s1000 [Marchantia polymorpha subsp. ruderalis]|uniref:Uncharacterized protein n=1 Tax=Marchantia polymorpha subsp. ruderalis TaxID=1480154 RepID=A0A176W050_MARPO|nr:hypothetical protein AXG93_2710s1000 [Marchantia polymorpha subsp. ruderalis]